MNNHDGQNSLYKIPTNKITLISPILRVTSLRDAYAFRQHVEAGRKSRGLAMIPEYDQFPVFYFLLIACKNFFELQ